MTRFPQEVALIKRDGNFFGSIDPEAINDQDINVIC
jgi:hypothetical protein